MTICLRIASRAAAPVARLATGRSGLPLRRTGNAKKDIWLENREEPEDSLRRQVWRGLPRTKDSGIIRRSTGRVDRNDQ